MKNTIDSLCDLAEIKCFDLERFPGYFKFKKVETFNIVDKLKENKITTVLEIGCGTGFQSSLLANLYNKVISTDLPYYSKTTHTIGLKDAKDMATRLNIRNIDHLACSAINLPFKDRSFDCVFSSGVLEHVECKDIALKEMRRVLTDDGIVVCSVPLYIESIFQFPSLYLYITKRVFDTINTRLFKKKVNHKSIFFNNDNKNRNYNIAEMVKKFINNNPSFPFPEPHGDWKNKKGRQSIFIEFHNQLPWNWYYMFLSSGLKITNSFAVLFIPYRIVEIFSPQLLVKMFCNTPFLHRKLADSFLKYFSTVICYVAKKREDAITIKISS